MTTAQFAKVVEQYQRLIYTICFQLVHDHHIAEDLAQETFLSAYRHIDNCPQENIRPWLARIATNKAKDHLKSAYNRKVMAAERESMSETEVLNVAPSQTPEDLAVDAEELEAIRNMVQELKEPYKMVSELYFLQEKSVEEVSKQLSRPVKTVHTQLYRAKRILQQKILERSVQV